MCGIAGKMFYDQKRPIDQKLVHRVLTSLRHRGPDSAGMHIDQGFFMGANRLKIVDPQQGTQPMYSQDKSLSIVFNGEIYNYQDLRKTLVGEGHTFKTNCDTEVVLYAYQTYGITALSKLNGMFAFAIWDSNDRSLFLARDRIGIKPIYYANGLEFFCFASELKGILNDPSITRDIDSTALGLYLSFGYIPDPFSIFKSIRKLPPAHYLKVGQEGITIRKYWDIIPKLKSNENFNSLKEEFLHLLEDSVKIRLNTNLPVGLFLSGGIDSSSLAALSYNSSGSFKRAYVMSFKPNSIYDETSHAEAIASAFEIPLNYNRLSSQELSQRFDDFVEQFDEPFADFTAIPTLSLCAKAAQNHKVIFTGDGCDELFAGYWRHRSEIMTEYFNKIPSRIRNDLLLPIIKRIPNWKITPSRYIKLLNGAYRKLNYSTANHELRYLFAQTNTLSEGRSMIKASFDLQQYIEILAQQYPSDHEDMGFMSRRLNLDLHASLPGIMLTKLDRSSMKYGLEARVPFLDHRIVEFSTKVPEQWKADLFTTKKFVRQAVKHLLPPNIIRRPKHGFSPPLEHWIRNELKDRFQDELNPNRIKRQNILDPIEVSKLLQEHLNGSKNNAKDLFTIWALCSWKEHYT